MTTNVIPNGDILNVKNKNKTKLSFFTIYIELQWPVQ